MAIDNPTQLYPMFVTDRLADTRRFYVEELGFQAVHDAECYLQVRYGDTGPQLAFMTPGAWPGSDASSPGARTFAGDGVVVSVPTDSADAKYDALRGDGLETLDAPTDRPWGWRSFLVRDPNGVVIDFFHVYKGAPVGANAAG